jgi:hypothetical protein
MNISASGSTAPSVVTGDAAFDGFFGMGRGFRFGAAGRLEAMGTSGSPMSSCSAVLGAGTGVVTTFGGFFFFDGAMD